MIMYKIGQKIKFISDVGQKLEGEITDFNDQAIWVRNEVIGLKLIGYDQVINDYIMQPMQVHRIEDLALSDKSGYISFDPGVFRKNFDDNYCGEDD